MGKYCDPKRLEFVWSSWQKAAKYPELSLIRDIGLLWTKNEGNVEVCCVASTMPYRFRIIEDKIQVPDLDAAIKASFYPLDLLLSRQLTAENFLYEQPLDDSWRELTSMIHQVCNGVALNFRPPNEDVKSELVQEAFTHILTKISRNKLKFDPRRPSPAFNLLTTAIFRIMYSIKNKEKRYRDHQADLVDRVRCGSKLPDFYSIKVSRSLVDQVKT